MGLFRSRKSRATLSPPLPDWDDTRWRSHLRANALGTEHHCAHHVEMIAADRKEAARLYQNDDHQRARNLAEAAQRNRRIVTALAALSPLCNALHKRSEPLAGYTSLVQIPEPARSGIVTIVFAAAHLQLSFLSETVNFLREQFGAVHIDQIQKAQGDLYPLVNATVRDALAPVPTAPHDVDAELASAVKQYFGVTIPSSSSPARTSALPATSSARSVQPSDAAIAATAAAAAATTAVAVTGSPALATAQVTDLRRTQTTPLSARSSEYGAPVSPQLSQEQARLSPLSHDKVLPATPAAPALPSARAPLRTALPPPPPPPEQQQVQPSTRGVEMLSSPFAQGVPETTARMRETAAGEGRRMYAGAAPKTSAAKYEEGLPELQSKVRMLSKPREGEGVKRGRTASVGAMVGGMAGAIGAQSGQVRDAAVSAPGRVLGVGEDVVEREQRGSVEEGGVEGESNRSLPRHLRDFEDSDEQLLARYEHMRLVISI